MKRKFALAATAAAALIGLGSTASYAAPAIVAEFAPPAIVHESIPAPREGFVWAPGHYEFRGGNYVWTPGYWMRERPGFEWEEAHWVRRADGTWRLVAGHWVETDDYAYNREFDDRRYRSRHFGPNGDLDRDGILNKDDRDRDGDGVANWNDDYPNNPNRS